jgi:hypothetical protein
MWQIRGILIQNSGGKILKKTEQLEDQGVDNTILLTLVSKRVVGKCKLNVFHDDTL